MRCKHDVESESDFSSRPGCYNCVIERMEGAESRTAEAEKLVQEYKVQNEHIAEMRIADCERAEEAEKKVSDQHDLIVTLGEKLNATKLREEQAEKERDGYRERVASLFDALDEAHEHLLDGGPCSSHGPHEDEGCLYCEMMSKISEALTPRPAAGEKP